jgi:hypothetical protein
MTFIYSNRKVFHIMDIEIHHLSSFTADDLTLISFKFLVKDF